MTEAIDRPDTLANPVWHSLTGHQAGVAQRAGAAVRFDPDINVFAAMDDPFDLDAWADLAGLAGPEGEVVLMRTAFIPAPGWRVGIQGRLMQFVAPAPVRPPDPDITLVELGEDDAEEMADLATRTRPGPWRPRTWTLGPFVGVREGGALVAMGGMRMHLPPYREVSAICTDPQHRGRGLAGTITSHLAQRIRADGEIPFLHTGLDNTPARRLYEALGFFECGPLGFGIYQPPLGALPDTEGGEDQGRAHTGEGAG